MSERRIPPWAAFAGLGLEMGTIVGVCTWGGYWIDQKFDSTPGGLLGGLILGLVAAGYTVYKALRVLSRGREAEDDEG